jgi:hypothetical protein
MHKKLSRFVAFILLLVFFQKSVVVLWMHNWLHGNSNTEYAKAHGNTTSLSQQNCTCLDDFFTPLGELGQPIIFRCLPVFTGYTEPASSYLFSRSPLFYSLRAPPAA